MTYAKKFATAMRRIIVHLRGLDQRIGLLGSRCHGVSVSGELSMTVTELPSCFSSVSFSRLRPVFELSGVSTIAAELEAIRAAEH